MYVFIYNCYIVYITDTLFNLILALFLVYQFTIFMYFNILIFTTTNNCGCGAISCYIK